MEKLNEILEKVAINGTKGTSDNINRRVIIQAKTAINQWHIDKVKELVGIDILKEVMNKCLEESSPPLDEILSEEFDDIERLAKAISSSILNKLEEKKNNE